MSLTKEEIMWLMENCGSPMPQEPTKGMSNITITGEPDHEFSMASRELDRTARYAQSLAAKMDQVGEANLPAWVQSKITKAADYISKVHHYLEEYLGYDDGMMSESAEGEIKKASHDVEIDVSISDADMKRLHDGEVVELKDTTGNNSFVVRIKS